MENPNYNTDGNILMRMYKKARLKMHADLHPLYSDVSMQRTMMAWMRNQTLLQQGINWERFENYQYIRKVHEFLTLYDIEDDSVSFKRVGQPNDGGYLMITPFSESKVAYSIGIATDVSWDKQMAQAGYDIYMYDHTIDELPEQNKSFHWEKTGLSGERDDAAHMDTLENLIKKNGHEKIKGMILKMDIEGWEWEVLGTIPESVLGQFDQIIMEMHGLLNYDNRKKILSGLEKLSTTHALIHVHGCNYEPISYCRNLVMPDVIEVALVRRGKYEIRRSNQILPNLLDQPCSKYSPEVWLGGWNEIE